MDHRVLYVVVGLLAVWLFYPRSNPDFDTLLHDVPINEELKEHSKEFNQAHVIKVTEGIHLAIGYAIANSIMIEAPDGVIIVDTTESEDSGRLIMEEFRKITKQPIKAIIYTHNHADHIFGAKAFVEDPDNLPEIWSHHTTVALLQRMSTIGLISYKRAMRQFGVLLPSRVNAGIGFRLQYGINNTSGFIPPSHVLKEEQEDVTIAGMKLRLIHIPGETPDQIGVWIPEKKALLCADDFYKAFPNLYAIRGTAPRDFKQWINSIDIMRNLRAEYLVPSHTNPLKGEEYIYTLLTEYRDAIQLIHDQTVRFMNQGMLPEDITEKIKLPPKLSKNPYLKEFYGTVQWSVKGVFNNYLGWFTGDPVDLWPLPLKEKAQKMVDFGGGVRATADAAETALHNGDTQWALELATHVLRIRPDNPKAKQVRFSALKNLGSKQISAPGRNYYLTCALEDLGLKNSLPDELRKQNIKRMQMQQLFNMMTVRFKAEECESVQTTLLFDFEDTNEKLGFYIRNSIAEFFLGEPETKADIIVHLKSTIWKEIASKERSPFKAYMDGSLMVEGGILTFRNVMSCFDQQ